MDMRILILLHSTTGDPRLIMQDACRLFED